MRALQFWLRSLAESVRESRCLWHILKPVNGLRWHHWSNSEPFLVGTLDSVTGHEISRVVGKFSDEDEDDEELPYHEEDMNPSTDFNAMSETCVQGRIGFKNRQGKFPDDLPPYRPNPGKSLKKFKITFFHVKMTVFLLPPYLPTGHCPNASMDSPPLPAYQYSTIKYYEVENIRRS